MHPLASRTAHAFFSSDPIAPQDFVTLVEDVRKLSPEEYGNMWADALEISTGEPVGAARRQGFARASGLRLVAFAQLSWALSKLPDKYKMKVIEQARRSAAE